jgi:hypothetical protein
MDEAASEIEQLRHANRVMAEDTRVFRWIDRDDREPPDTDRQYLLYTTAMEGFVWLGRKGLLPRSVTHWCEMPEPPPSVLRQDEPAPGQP